MSSREFAYWLQGFFEISKAESINKEQTEMIKRHLNLVFFHEIDPSYGVDTKQEQMNAIHSGNLPFVRPPNSYFASQTDPLIRC